jgi:hypothetical protein
VTVAIICWAHLLFGYYGDILLDPLLSGGDRDRVLPPNSQGYGDEPVNPRMRRAPDVTVWGGPWEKEIERASP